VIDWTNALVGFGLGVVTTLLFWIPDRIRSERLRRAEAWESWKVAMKDLELLAWKPETRSNDLYVARARYPIDLWRAVLRDREGFHLFEKLEQSYWSVEYRADQLTANSSDETMANFAEAEARWLAARVAFANYSRNAQSAGYTILIRTEERQKDRRDLLRHPIRTSLRLRHNRHMRATATSAPETPLADS
jgi:hypothetical protein